MKGHTTPETFMRRAIELSKRGFPAPNPHVGCILVNDGEIVGEGWHEFYGGPHAEIVALEEAGAAARGATAYVTLEPCNHQGQTGPCSKALIEAGVSRVVYACTDPNPVAKGGAGALQDAGVEVESGLLREEAAAANVRFLRSLELGRPFVVLKVAMSLDGRIALPSGESQWITGVAARKQGHTLRAEMGAVLVGRGTVAADDPSLTARLEGVRNQPLRIVLDPHRSLDETYKVFSDGGNTLRVVRPGLEGLEIPYADRFDLHALMAELTKRKVNGLLVEGGARTHQAFMEADLVDRLEIFVAPIVLGVGPAWIEGGAIDRLENSKRFKIVDCRRLGEDLQLSLERA